jgi:hypothetical protein
MAAPVPEIISYTCLKLKNMLKVISNFLLTLNMSLTPTS